jgi:hypothetical protein
MPSPWDAHKPPTYGQDHVGEQISNMEIESRANGPEGLSMKLKCPRDNTEFWVQLWAGGQNAVVRNGDQIHAQCPGCGVEWNGEPAHFYAIAITKKLGLLQGGATELGIVDSLVAKDPYDALTKVISEELIPEVLRSGQDNYRGLTITEITEVEHKVLALKKRAMKAMEDNDPNLMEVLDRCMKEEQELTGKPLNPLDMIMKKHQQGGSDGNNMLDKLMAVMQTLKEIKNEADGRSGGFPR